MVKLEDIYKELNPVGLAQILVTLMVGGALFCGALFPLLLTLLTSSTGWECVSTDCNSSLPLCEQNLADNQWVYPPSAAAESFIKYYDLACYPASSISLVNSLYFVGYMFGSSGGGMFSDYAGRKAGLLLILAIITTSTLMRIFCQTFVEFSALQIISGLCMGGTNICGMTCICEYMHGRVRNVASHSGGLMYIFGMLYSTAVVMVAGTWQQACLWLFAPCLMSGVLIAVFLKESPFWLLNKGEITKMHLSLAWMATRNNTTYTKNIDVDEKGEPKSESIYSVLTHWTVNTRTTLILIFSWVSVSFSYWSLSFNVGNLGGDIFMTQIQILSLDVLTKPLLVIVLEYIKRTHFFLIGSGLLCILSLLCMIPLQTVLFWDYTLSKLSAVLGRIVAELLFSLVYLYTAEVYPTSMRASGLGLCSSAARIGSFVAPFVVLLNVYSANILFMIVFVMSGVSFVIFFWMPETKDKRLPETLSDMANLFQSGQGVECQSLLGHSDVETQGD